STSARDHREGQRRGIPDVPEPSPSSRRTQDHGNAQGREQAGRALRHPERAETPVDALVTRPRSLIGHRGFLPRVPIYSPPCSVAPPCGCSPWPWGPRPPPPVAGAAGATDPAPVGPAPWSFKPKTWSSPARPRPPAAIATPPSTSSPTPSRST